MGPGTVYLSSDGRYFGDADLWERFESGAWTPCCWDEENGYEWVEAGRGELLLLVPISRCGLPDGTTVEQNEDGVRIDAARVTADN